MGQNSHLVPCSQSRIRSSNQRQKKWECHALRSFAETISWLYISMQLHNIYQDPKISAPLGALSGFGVVVLGDLLTSLVHNTTVSMNAKLGDLYAMELFLVVVLLGVGITYRTQLHAPAFGLALVEPICAGACLVAICQ